MPIRKPYINELVRKIIGGIVSLNSHLQEIVGKRITHVITNTGGNIGTQVFFVFDDDTTMEFYGDIQNTKGLNCRNFEETVEYANGFSGTLTVYGIGTKNN